VWRGLGPDECDDERASMESFVGEANVERGVERKRYPGFVLLGGSAKVSFVQSTLLFFLEVLLEGSVQGHY